MTLVEARPATGRPPIPPLIRRNTVLLAGTQAVVGMGNQMTPTLGAIMAVRLTGSATVAGLATSILNLSRFLIAYPIGVVADRYGRRAALLIGYALGVAGALVIGFSMVLTSLPLYVMGLLVFGLGVGAGQQLRLAAADLYPPNRRAEGLGFVLTGSLVGAFGGPLLISAAEAYAPGLRLDPIALAWFLVPGLLVPAMALVLMIRPDPKEVATNLARYYPGYVPAAPRRGAEAPPASTGARAWIAHYPLRVAFVSSFAAQGTMTLMMAMTSLALDHHGHALPMISLSVAIHVVGMFGFSIPLGRLADRVGRRNMLVVGSLISALGSALVAFGADYWPISLGTFLVGLGWCCTHVSVTAMIADFVPPTDRGRAIGTNDSFSTLGSVLLPLAGGPLVELFGLPILAVVGAGLMVVPLLMQLRLSGGRADR